MVDNRIEAEGTGGPKELMKGEGEGRAELVVEEVEVGMEARQRRPTAEPAAEVQQLVEVPIEAEYSFLKPSKIQFYFEGTLLSLGRSQPLRVTYVTRCTGRDI